MISNQPNPNIPLNQSCGEVTTEYFSEIFQILGHFIDPFERYFNIGTDRTNGRRIIIKSYYINSHEQEKAILENLTNYYSLRKIDTLCPMICYAKPCEEQIDVAFDFHRFTLEQYLNGVEEEAKDYYFFVKLLEGVAKGLAELKNEEVEVDDIRTSNVLVDIGESDDAAGGIVFRIFYDERQKNKCLSLDKLYLSPERLEEWRSGNFGAYYFEDKIVFECGLMLLDVMTEECQESFYLNVNEFNWKTLERKLLMLEQRYQGKELPGLIEQMVSEQPQRRPNLEQIVHRCSSITQSRVSAQKSHHTPSQTPSKSSASHSNFTPAAELSHYTNTKQSTTRLRVFSDLDFIFINPSTHQDSIQQLHKIKSRIDHLEFECKRYQDGSVYYGELSGNIREGIGIYTYANGDIFFGNWNNNAATQGGYIFQSGETYHGGVKNGKHGRGIYRYANGNTYDGLWQNDLKQGRGEMKYSNGDRYQGNWSKGKKHGLGVYQYSNGIIFQGNFIFGAKSGQCTILFPDKTRFDGNWQDSCVEGFGKMMYDNGDQYQGYYQDSQKNGAGTFRWSNKTTYQGGFSQDCLSGKCVIYYPNKQFYEGSVVDGMKNGEGVYQYENGDIFRGTWRNDEKWVGQYAFYDGSMFEGEFHEGMMRKGRMSYGGGDYYEGEFRYGQRDGRGKYVASGGEVVEGEWRGDAFVKT